MAISFRNSRLIENAGEKFRENLKCQIVEHVCQGDELLHFSLLFHAYTLIFTRLYVYELRE